MGNESWFFVSSFFRRMMLQRKDWELNKRWQMLKLLSSNVSFSFSLAWSEETDWTSFETDGSRQFMESYWRFVNCSLLHLSHRLLTLGTIGRSLWMTPMVSCFVSFELENGQRAPELLWFVHASLSLLLSLLSWHLWSSFQLAACIKWRMGSDVEKIFEKGEEGMQNAEGFIKQMVSLPLSWFSYRLCTHILQIYRRSERLILKELIT